VRIHQLIINIIKSEYRQKELNSRITFNYK